jgi:trans-2,3-dihydro-3-hydroxyanthranilate isomerase
MTEIAYETLDVFTEARFGGNPLAVIADARSLSTGEMQSIAREFNYSESTFVTPPSDSANTARVRIFTPASEIPFAGHPNVGTAFALGRMESIFGKAVGDVMRFEEGAGLVEVALVRRDGQVAGASIRAPRQLERGEELAPEVVAACASLRANEIVSKHHGPVFASVGLPFIVAELQSVESLAKATPDTAAFVRAREEYGGEEERFSLFLYVRLSPSRVRARMFAPLTKVPEDPATGSASAALGALLASLGHDGEAFQLTIEQGVEMGRPSLIQVRVGGQHGKRDVFVGGGCIPVMRGAITV